MKTHRRTTMDYSTQIFELLYRDNDAKTKKREFRELKKLIKEDYKIEIAEYNLTRDQACEKVVGWGRTLAEERRDAASRRRAIKIATKEAILATKKNERTILRAIDQVILKIPQVLMEIRERKENIIKNRAIGWVYLFSTMANLDEKTDENELAAMNVVLEECKKIQDVIGDDDFDNSVKKGTELFLEIKKNALGKNANSSSALLQEAVRQMSCLKEDATREQLNLFVTALFEIAKIDGSADKEECAFYYFTLLYSNLETKGMKLIYNELDGIYSSHKRDKKLHPWLLKKVTEVKENIDRYKKKLSGIIGKRKTYEEFGLDASPEAAGFKRKYYRKPFFIFVMLILLAPLGIYYYILRRRSKKTDVNYWNSIEYLLYSKAQMSNEAECSTVIKLYEEQLLKKNQSANNIKEILNSFQKGDFKLSSIPKKSAEGVLLEIDKPYDRDVLFQMLSYVPNIK